LLAMIVLVASMSAGQLAAQTVAGQGEGGAPAAAAEPPAPEPSKSEGVMLFREVASDFRHFPSGTTALWLGFAGGLSLVARPNEKHLNNRFVGADWVDDFFDSGKVAGEGYTQVGAAVLTYAIGCLSHQPKVRHIGSDLIRSHALAGTPTFIIKHVVGRLRPDNGHASFPSGHASVTFASATVLERHFGWRAGVPAYLVASWVAASRLHENRHFASDVIFGAALGIAAGRTVTRHGRTTWAVVPAASAGRIGIAVTRTSGGNAGDTDSGR
jgi:membrane-associated phospholipid phosphatase